MTTPTLIFDLDGTLSDPLEGIWRSLNYALEAFDYEPCTRESAAAFIGPPLDETFSILTDAGGEHLVQLVVKFRERFAEVGYAENELYPGIREALSCLAEKNIPMGVCTAKRQDFALKILKMFELSEHFAFVSGGDIGIKKSHQLQTLLHEGSIDSRALMIGDRSIDLIAAHTNGLNSAGVLWGYGSQSELEAETPKHLLHQPYELTGLIG